ncbi:putative vesicle-associated membrane protein 726 isoform X1 [Lycium barbarum]|uniref:putative vesicle-associated membrane protein 726 isoform X1 n=1 Tax=Lycium barbarum TaxID=112863 RepID=UPI00293E4B54|nr:putative vesicle-associated membrane protein 726 isoform X1 [Lycium barbarum]
MLTHQVHLPRPNPNPFNQPAHVYTHLSWRINKRDNGILLKWSVDRVVVVMVVVLLARHQDLAIYIMFASAVAKIDELAIFNWRTPRFANMFEPSYCVVATESAGRQLPIAFLERIKDDFTKRYGGGKATTATPKSLSKEFGPKLKEHMKYCVDHPEEINKLAKVKAQVSEVKGVMMQNIEKVLDRGEKIELLVDKTENLRSQAQDFRQQGTKIRRKLWYENMKIKLIVLGIIIALILIIVLSVCPRFDCF